MVTTFEKTSGYRYRVEYSSDGVNWATFEDHTAAATTAQTNCSIPLTAVSARYMRLTVTGSNYNGGSVYEIQVYGGF